MEINRVKMQKGNNAINTFKMDTLRNCKMKW